jgi:hypothetical protein
MKQRTLKNTLVGFLAQGIVPTANMHVVENSHYMFHKIMDFVPETFFKLEEHISRLQWSLVQFTYLFDLFFFGFVFESGTKVGQCPGQ